MKNIILALIGALSLFILIGLTRVEHSLDYQNDLISTQIQLKAMELEAAGIVTLEDSI